METIRVKIKATVTKIIAVTIETEGLTQDEIEDKAIELANEEFNINGDSKEESYDQEATVID